MSNVIWEDCNCNEPKAQFKWVDFSLNLLVVAARFVGLTMKLNHQERQITFFMIYAKFILIFPHINVINFNGLINLISMSYANFS